MESAEKRMSGPFPLPVVTIFEWLMVLLATAFLAAGALRTMQPRQYEPAHTSAILFEWTAAHVSRLGAAIVFLGMPGLVVLAGGGTLLHLWRADTTLRRESAMTFAILRRHLSVGLLMAAVLLAGAVLAAVAVHNLTD